MTKASDRRLAEGWNLHLAGDFKAASAVYNRILTKDRSNADAWHLLGVVANTQQRYSDAVPLLERAVRIDPRPPVYRFNLAISYVELGRLDEAEALVRGGLKEMPRLAPAWTNLGLILQQRGDTAGALDCYQRSLSISPTAAALINVGHVAGLQMQLEKACSYYRQALQIDPGCIPARYNLSTALLAQGKFVEGLPLHECREARMTAEGTRWTGQPLEGKTVLILFEQGHGDVIQFCRFIPILKRRGARVMFIVPSALFRLMGTLPGVDVLIDADAGGRFLTFDYFVSLMSLPYLFGMTLETIPAAVPYLAADPAPWADVLTGMKGLRVGLVWAGRRREERMSRAVDARRSMSFEQMSPLLDVPGCSFVSLQLGPPASQLKGAVLDVSDKLTHFADTAGLVASLDLVISVDTSVAHLAGALNKPVWLLSRFDSCWRWLCDREDSPWYPSARLFRQKASGDWAPLIAEAKAALEDLVHLKAAA